LNGAPPVFVVEIPVDGAAQSVCQHGFSAKTEVARQLVGACCIPPVVARPVLDESY
jgi:hypothetical protein